ncbi:MAG: cytochrome b/b6 domain-containing protein [Pseudomonadota bacterium]|nr:cytochrome b/b6 domain-containing protein [Sphingomonas sp.]MDQ3477584.1 cytochrome b/b6 domain-containing protein [Pseudomonadota bacterium]
MKSTEPSDADAAPRVAVWDLPTRLFHWLLVALIAFSWWTAEQGRTEWHLYSGYSVMTLLLFRLMWGFVGSSTARFKNFVRGPRAVLGYVRDMRGWSGIGHTPLGALSVVALLGLVAFQVATGLINTDDDGLVEGPLAPLVSFDVSDAAHDLHDDAFDILLVFIAFHVTAIVIYRLALRKRLLAPMITGLARIESKTEPMRPARKWLALACLAAAIAITRWIIAGAAPFGT